MPSVALTGLDIVVLANRAAAMSAVQTPLQGAIAQPVFRQCVVLRHVHGVLGRAHALMS